MVVTPWSRAGMVVLIPPLAAETNVAFLYSHLSEQKLADRRNGKLEICCPYIVIIC